MKLLYAALILLTGCVSTEKAISVLEKRGELARVAAERFPPKTEYIQGKVITRSDTTFLPGDSIPCPPTINGRDTIIQKVKCPGRQIIRDTTIQVDTFRVENTALVNHQARQISKQDGEIKAKDDHISRLKRQRWYFSLGGFLLAIGGMLLAKIYFKI